MQGGDLYLGKEGEHKGSALDWWHGVGKQRLLPSLMALGACNACHVDRLQRLLVPWVLAFLYIGQHVILYSS